LKKKKRKIEYKIRKIAIMKLSGLSDIKQEIFRKLGFVVSKQMFARHMSRIGLKAIKIKTFKMKLIRNSL